MRAFSWFRHRIYSLLLLKEAYFPYSKLLVDAWHSASAESFKLTSCTPAYAPCRYCRRLQASATLRTISSGMQV